MNENRMMSQVNAIFGIFMTIFYIGVGLFIFFMDKRLYDRNSQSLFNIVSVFFILYGIYRGYRTFMKVRDVFFSKHDDEK